MNTAGNHEKHGDTVPFQSGSVAVELVLVAREGTGISILPERGEAVKTVRI